MRKIILPALLLLSNLVFAQKGFHLAGGKIFTGYSPSLQFVMSGKIFYTHRNFDIGGGIDFGGLNSKGKVKSDIPSSTNMFSLVNDPTYNSVIYWTPYVYCNYGVSISKSFKLYGGGSFGNVFFSQNRSGIGVYHEVPGHYNSFYSMKIWTGGFLSTSIGAHLGVFYKLTENLSFNIDGSARKMSVRGAIQRKYQNTSISYPDDVERRIRQSFLYYPIIIGIRYQFSERKKPQPVEESHGQTAE